MKLSAFADEISPDINKQIAVLHEADIRAVDLRSVDGVNVLDFTDDAAASYAAALQSAEIDVAAIGSPIGKVPIDTPVQEQTARFERAVALAHRFNTTNIRIFSFYRAAGREAPPAQYREDVLARLGEMTERARAEGITLLHENDVDLYGDTVARCLDLLNAIDDPHFRAAFDPANFILSGEEPYPAAYESLRPWIAAVHVKDAHPGGPVVPAGEGIARWQEISRALKASGYDGYLALEPHLAAAGQLGGFSGPDRFRVAARSLKELLALVGWQPE
jgi:sugar phosphate isomerase/epimerase